MDAFNVDPGVKKRGRRKKALPTQPCADDIDPMKKDGFSLSEQVKQAQIQRKIEETDVEVIVSEVAKKRRIEEKAWVALDQKLESRTKQCPKCGGAGANGIGEPCKQCGGAGHVDVEADMRAVEMVLSPKFPKTVINLSKSMDDMSTEDIVRMILGQ